MQPRSSGSSVRRALSACSSTTPATARAARSRSSRSTMRGRQFETNVFGLVRLTQLVLPGMREQGWGRIVNVSSMGGELTFPAGGWYHATKHAVEAISDALRIELPVRDRGRRDPAGPDPDALRRGGRRIDRGRRRGVCSASTRPSVRRPRVPTTARSHARRGGGPETVAKAIERAVTAKRPRTRYRVTPSARLFINDSPPPPRTAAGTRSSAAATRGRRRRGSARRGCRTSSAAGRPTTFR